MKRRLTTALIFVACFGLAGCGVQSPVEPPPAQHQDGAAEPAEQPTADPDGGDDPTSAARLTIDDFAERVTAAQLDAATVHVSQRFESGAYATATEGNMTMTAEIESVKAELTMEMPTGTSEVRVVDGAMYMNLGDISGGKFMEFAGSTPDGTSVESIIGLLSPKAQLDTFGKSILELTAGDGEELDGVPTTKYTLVLDTKTLLSSELLADVDPKTIGDTMEYVAWVADDDLPRRARMTIGDAVWTSNYSKWGVPFEVEAPGPDELIELG